MSIQTDLHIQHKRGISHSIYIYGKAGESKTYRLGLFGAAVTIRKAGKCIKKRFISFNFRSWEVQGHFAMSPHNGVGKRRAQRWQQRKTHLPSFLGSYFCNSQPILTIRALIHSPFSQQPLGNQFHFQYKMKTIRQCFS